MVQSRIIHQVQLLGGVKDQRVVVLLHEERLHLPLALLYGLLRFIIAHDRQGETGAFQLQTLAGRIVEEEVVEEFVGSDGHGRIFLAERSRQGVGPQRVSGLLLNELFVGRRIGMLLPTFAGSQERDQHAQNHREQDPATHHFP